MYLHNALMARADKDNLVRACLIREGKFGAMFLSQIPTTPGLTVSVIADLKPDAARDACRKVGWTEERAAATDFTDDVEDAVSRDDVDEVIEVSD